MPSKVAIIYIYPYVANESIDWLTNTCKHLSRYSQTLFLSQESYHRPIQIKSVFSNWKTFKDTFLYFHNLLIKKKFIEVRFYDFLPFTRFNIIKKINKKLYFLPLSLFKKRLSSDQKIVVVVAYPNPLTSLMIKKIKPHLVVGDVADIWSQKSLKRLEKYDLAVANSQPVFEIAQKHNPNTHLISAGYFSKSFLNHLKNKNVYDPNSKTILFIGNITWRQDFDLLLSIIKKLPDYKFLFIGADLFYVVKDPDKTRLDSQETKWHQIKKLKNVEFIPIKNGADLKNINFKASVALIPLVKNKFNHYCHPIKFYYYLSLKLPVVSVPIRSLDAFAKDPNCLRFAENLTDWIKNIKELSLLKSKSKNSLKSAYQHTFEAKAKTIIKLVSTCLSA